VIIECYSLASYLRPSRRIASKQKRYVTQNPSRFDIKTTPAPILYQVDDVDEQWLKGVGQAKLKTKLPISLKDFSGVMNSLEMDCYRVSIARGSTVVNRRSLSDNTRKSAPATEHWGEWSSGR